MNAMHLLKLLLGGCLCTFMVGCCDWDDRFDKEFECVPAFKAVDTTRALSVIAFGSCGHQDEHQPILEDAAQSGADLFVFLGDNVYVDSEDCDVFFEEYSKLVCKPPFVRLVTSVPTVAVWDDHDYGENDAGKDYPLRNESKDVFMRFWQEPVGSSRFDHAGIYHSMMFGDTAKRVQLILLDMRTFRSPLSSGNGGYVPDSDPGRSFLGVQQWAWLREQLRLPAKVRVIASSTQFAIEHNGWEAWANLPLEQQRMADLIAETGANGVVFITGDVHYSELSRQVFANCYPLYDCTASGLTELDEPVGNQFRIGAAIAERNFGKLTIDWQAAPVQLTYSVHAVGGGQRFSHTFSLDEISF
jgi:alkaline phosphatase D